MSRFLTILLFFLATAAHAGDGNLGFGFQLVGEEVINPPDHWEGIGHFSFLYYRDRQLCSCGSGDVSIAPSGKFAIFQDGPSGKLLLFNVVRDSIKEVTGEFIGSPQTFTWHEVEGIVTVTFYQGIAGYKNAPPLSVQLR